MRGNRRSLLLEAIRGVHCRVYLLAGRDYSVLLLGVSPTPISVPNVSGDFCVICSGRQSA